MILMSAIIPTYSRGDLARRCIEALLRQTIGQVQVIVVDNASPDELGRGLHQLFGPAIEVVRTSRNLFFCGAVNRGILQARGKLVAVINDDCIVAPDWAENAIQAFVEHPELGSVASVVVQDAARDRIDSAGDHLDVTGRASNLRHNEVLQQTSISETEVFSAAGSCAVYRRRTLMEIGGFDEDFVAYLDDIDVGFRLRLRGYPALLKPACRACHVGGGTPKDSRYAAYLTERNMVWNLLKNMPASLLAKYWAQIMFAQGKPAPIVGGPFSASWLAGKAAAVHGGRKFLEKRKSIQAGARVSVASLESLFLSHRVVSCHL